MLFIICDNAIYTTTTTCANIYCDDLLYNCHSFLQRYHLEINQDSQASADDDDLMLMNVSCIYLLLL